METNRENRTRKHIFWQIVAIIILNAMVITAIGFVYENTQTLSSIGSRGQEVRQIQNKLKELAISTKRVVLEINQVGAIDGWSYSGQSKACDENGNIFAKIFVLVLDCVILQ